MEKIVSSRSGRLLGDALLGWFPFLVILVMTPLNIYFSNQLDFDFDVGALAPFLAAAALSFAAIYAIRFRRRGSEPKFTYAQFFVGLFLVASDSLVPLQWGLMDGSEELHEAWSSVGIQLGLAIVLFAGWYVLPRAAVRGFAIPLVLVAVAWQAATLVRILAKEPPSAVAATTPAPTLATGDHDRDRPNIYQIVFDGYSSLMFRQAAEQTGLLEELQGFTFFPNNMSNYESTDASVPSFMTGTLFKGGSFKDFQTLAREGGLRLELQKAGYEISTYAPDRSRFWMFDGSDHVFTSRDLNLSGGALSQLVQTTAVRTAPEILRREVLSITSLALFGSKALYSNYKRQSVPLMEQLLADEPARPDRGQYVHAHLILPHAPYVWSEDCQPEPKTNPQKQTLCATKLMGDFVRLLKKLGRYEESVVVLQSDHGREIDAEPVFKTPPPEIAKREPKDFFDRLHALLLVKPPASDAAALQMSGEMSQLADIPATIYDLVGLAPPPTDGHSVFALEEVRDREISIFSGIRSNFGKTLDVLFKTRRATLRQLGYNPDRGWRILPDVEATHEGW